MHNVASLVTTKKSVKCVPIWNTCMYFKMYFFMIWQSSLVQCPFIANKNILLKSY